MDVIGSHVARLPAVDERWIPRPCSRDELIEGLIEGGAAGPAVAHPMDNVLRHIDQLCAGDPDKQFGMSGLPGSLSPVEVLGLVGRASGFEPDPEVRTGPVGVDPGLVLAACEAVGERLALACERGERMILATGHPVGLALLYGEVARALATRGVKILRPCDGVAWREGDRHHMWQVRYLDGFAILTDKANAKHTHSGEPMRRMLEEERPDLVFADHGFAGSAIEVGIETLSIADVNDPALIVAAGLGRTRTVVVMDDNVQPDAYWPCFQAVAAKLP